MTQAARHTSGSIAELVKGTLVGAADRPVAGLAAVTDAGPDQLTFIVDIANASRWAGSRGGTAIVTARDQLGLDIAGGLRLAFAFTAAWWLLFSLPAAVARFGSGNGARHAGNPGRELLDFARSLWGGGRGDADDADRVCAGVVDDGRAGAGGRGRIGDGGGGDVGAAAGAVGGMAGGLGWHGHQKYS
jgi:hypothetical protein